MKSNMKSNQSSMRVPANRKKVQQVQNIYKKNKKFYIKSQSRTRNLTI